LKLYLTYLALDLDKDISVDHKQPE
jgi:hypothetical protein